MKTVAGVPLKPLAMPERRKFDGFGNNAEDRKRFYYSDLLCPWKQPVANGVIEPRAANQNPFSGARGLRAGAALQGFTGGLPGYQEFMP